MVIGAAVAAALSGCGGGGDDDEDLIGPDRSYTKAVEIGEDEWNAVSDIVDAEGWTPWTDLPLSGTATYRGVIGGWADGGAPVDYVADLELNVDFGDASVKGSVRNMVTDHVADFTHPDGRVRLSGYLAPDEFDEGILVIGGSGTLETDAVAATVIVDGVGGFAGNDGRAILGPHQTDFVWTRGPAAGTTSFSDGLFAAERE